jgi:hypothetical protein
MFDSCKKYYKTQSRIVDINGLKSKLGSFGKLDFEVAAGEISIKPDYIKTSEKLYALDQMQYNACESIKRIKDKAERDKQQIELSKILIEMLKISTKQDKFEETISNTVIIVGDNNITLQDIEGGTIKIVKNDSEGIKELKEEYLIEIIAENKITSQSDISSEFLVVDLARTQLLLMQSIENIGNFVMLNLKEYYVSIRNLSREKQIEDLSFFCWRDDKLSILIAAIKNSVPGLYKSFIKSMKNYEK